MFIAVIERNSQSVEVEVDPDDDFDVFRFQVLSLFEDVNDEFVVIDFAGREITTMKDIIELRKSGRKEEVSAKVFVWIIDMSFNVVKENICSNELFCCDIEKTESDKSEKNDQKVEKDVIIQPRYRIIDTYFDMCFSCKRHISPSLIQSTTESPMITLHPFKCNSGQAAEFGLTLDSYCKHDDTGLNFSKVNPENPVGKYFRWHYMQAAIDQQSSYSQNSTMTEGERQVDARLRSGVKTVQVYEDEEQQRRARECIDFAKVHLVAHILLL